MVGLLSPQKFVLALTCTRLPPDLQPGEKNESPLTISISSFYLSRSFSGPLGRPMIQWIKDVDTVYNLRDLGCDTFPLGTVYRSADLSHLGSRGLFRLSHYIHTIIDVRSLPEIQKNGTVGPAEDSFTDADLRPLGIVRLHAPVFQSQNYSPEEIARRHNLYKLGHEGFLSAYRGILDNIAGPLRTIFELLDETLPSNKSDPSASQTADAPSSPPLGDAPTANKRGILIHCSAGKDRTGILCALLLSTTETPRPVIVEDYSVTAKALEPLIPEVLNRLNSLHPGDPHAATSSRPPLTDPERAKQLAAVKQMMGSDAKVMERTLEMIEAEYGGFEKFMCETLGAELYHSVKQKLMQQVPPTASNL